VPVVHRYLRDMSQPPEQPSAYPYPHPQSPGGNPYAQQPVPQNPYAQNPYAQNPYPQNGPPPQSGPYGQPGPYGAGMPPGQPPRVGGGGRRPVLWAVVGACVASVLWGGGLLAYHAASGDGVDLGSYRFQKNLCGKADVSPFLKEYPEKDDSPTNEALRHPAMDSMYCTLSLKKSGSTFSDAYLSISVDFHKKSNPTPEFTATWETYSQRSGYKVRKLPGFGDQAYLVTQEPSASGTSGSHSDTLAVRDGSVTYSMGWSAYSSSTDTSDVPSVADITPLLKSATRTTLARISS
jgi:hypothetical protein